MFLICCYNRSCMMKVENVDLNIATFKYLNIPRGCYLFKYNFWFFHHLLYFLCGYIKFWRFENTFQNYCIIKKNSWKNKKQRQNVFKEALLFLALYVKKIIFVHKFFSEVTLGLYIKFFRNSFFRKYSYSLPKLETQTFRKWK